jgi:NADP-dependent 3-hydroxy acid dehydrogenase YdfG
MQQSADHTDGSQTRKVIDAVLEVMGDVNILVNNAGIIRRGSVAE